MCTVTHQKRSVASNAYWNFWQTIPRNSKIFQLLSLETIIKQWDNWLKFLKIRFWSKGKINPLRV